MLSILYLQFINLSLYSLTLWRVSKIHVTFSLYKCHTKTNPRLEACNTHEKIQTRQQPFSVTQPMDFTPFVPDYPCFSRSDRPQLDQQAISYHPGVYLRNEHPDDYPQPDFYSQADSHPSQGYYTYASSQPYTSSILSGIYRLGLSFYSAQGCFNYLWSSSSTRGPGNIPWQNRTLGGSHLPQPESTIP